MQNQKKKGVGKRMIQKIVYWLFRLLIGVISLIPFSILYVLSDGLAFLLQRIIRYRKSVIEQNIRNSFPEKTPSEIKTIIYKFYRNLSDIILEGAKGYSYPPEKLAKRFLILSNPKLKTYYENGKSVILTGAHFSNWEWGMMCGGLYSYHHVMCYYQPIRNEFINEFYRNRFSTGRNLTTVSKKQVIRNVVVNQKNTVAHLLISDQSPSSLSNGIWIDFLNQDTLSINGPEKLARKFDFPVFYMNFIRVKRGWYKIEITELIDKPKETQEGEITKMFMNTLEQNIQNKPENWLWSHKRWKKKRPV
jgi:KDO2-lipid IV(A) lauroyltransferase